MGPPNTPTTLSGVLGAAAPIPGDKHWTQAAENVFWGIGIRGRRLGQPWCEKALDFTTLPTYIVKQRASRP